MRKSSSTILAVLLLCAALVSAMPAQADSLSFTSASSGVGTVCGGGVDPISGANFTSGATTANVSCNSAASSGSLTADLLASEPTSGVQLVDNGVPSEGEVLIADGFRATAPATVSYTIMGSFSGFNADADTEMSISIASYNYYLATNGGFQDSVNFYTNGPNGAPEYDVCSNVTGTCSVAGGAWTGSYTLTLPVAMTDTGFILDISADASGDPGMTIDFSDPVSVGFTPAAGGSVTLATGQVFGGSPVTIPEPSSLLLLGSALLTLVGARDKLRLA